MARKNRPHTPDGRYLVSRGILKRCTNPDLDNKTRRTALKKLVQARMANDQPAVLAAKTALGEAGPVWWDDGAADHSGLLPINSIYKEWWLALTEAEQAAGLAEKKKMSENR